MPLPLNDPRWRELRSSDGSTEDVLKWLTEAYRSGGLTEARLGDLINEIQHQGGTSTAMYAVAPHLLELARRAQAPKDALALLSHAGLIYVSSRESGAAACPSFLIDEFNKSAKVGAAILSSLLPLVTDFDTYKWAVAGLAGFVGLDMFAQFLDGLDYHEGKFYHQLIDGSFPAE